MEENDSVVSSVEDFSSKDGGTDPEVSDGDEDRKNAEIGEVENLIKEETRVISTWRVLVLMAMVLASTAVTFATYVILSNQEDNDFERSVSKPTECCKVACPTSQLSHSICVAITVRRLCVHNRRFNEFPAFRYSVKLQGLRGSVDSVSVDWGWRRLALLYK